MNPKSLPKLMLAAGALAFAGPSLALHAQATKSSMSAPAKAGSAQTASTGALGTVRIPRQVLADGKPLPGGTYSIRLASDSVTPVVGQSPDAEHWVEFLQGGVVKGRELATVETSPAVKGVAKMPPPPAGASKIQVLKGADYLRIWINQNGTHYLVHLPTAVTSAK